MTVVRIKHIINLFYKYLAQTNDVLSLLFPYFIRNKNNRSRVNEKVSLVVLLNSCPNLIDDLYLPLLYFLLIRYINRCIII